MASPPPRRRLTLAHLLLVLPWVALVVDAWAPIRDNSFLWHIRAGELQMEAGSVLTADPFSFTMSGERWLTQSWLAELLYAWGERNWGLGFVPPMMLLLGVVVFLGLGLVAYLRSRSVTVTALLLVLGSVLLLSFLVPRPVMFSFALFALVVVAWERPATRWALPFLFWVWASVHGSFAIGLAYIGLSLIMGREWKALPTAVVSGLATLLTAHGLGVIGILLDFTKAGPALALLSEWRRPELISWVFTPFLIGVALIVIGAYRARITPRHLWLLVPFLLLGFGATRAVPPAWIALVPLMALALRDWGSALRPRFSTVSTAVFVTVVLVFPFLVAGNASIDEGRFPVVAAAYLEDVPTFSDDRAGGYLIWAQGPERKVFIDDRAELYGDRLAELVAVRDGETDWRPVFERDGIAQALLRTDWGLADRLVAAGWEVVYRDPDYMVLRP